MRERPTLESVGGWPSVLGKLTRSEDLTADEASTALANILEGLATPAQIAAFGVALRMKGETVGEMNAMLGTLLAFGVPVSLPEGIDAIDTCGTGGDRSGTINVSTLAAFVAAGAGAHVCKHGNRVATSACGSADVLEALGVTIGLGPAGVAACVEQAGMGFCFAPQYHAALRHAGPARREIGVPTVFNFLGPLANPARVRRQVLGISDRRMADRVVGVLAARGTARALVVWGHDGLDELSTSAVSTVMELRDGDVRTYTVDPEALGLRLVRPADVRGGDPTTNAALARRVLDGERGPHRDFVVLNAAAGLVASARVDTIADGLESAMASIDEGRAAGVLDRLVAVSKEQAAAEATASEAAAATPA